MVQGSAPQLSAAQPTTPSYAEAGRVGGQPQMMMEKGAKVGVWHGCLSCVIG